MKSFKELIKEVNRARQKFISTASFLSSEQANFKPSEEAWSISENVEHIVWAELGAINGIWKTAQAIKKINRCGLVIQYIMDYPLRK